MYVTLTQQTWASLTVRQKQVEDIFGYEETHYTIIHCPVKREEKTEGALMFNNYESIFKISLVFTWDKLDEREGGQTFPWERGAHYPG